MFSFIPKKLIEDKEKEKADKADEAKAIRQAIPKETYAKVGWLNAFYFNELSDLGKVMLLDEKDQKKIVPAMHSFAGTKHNHFVVLKSSRDDSMHGTLADKSGILRKNVISAGDILFSQEGKIVFCCPKSRLFRGHMWSAINPDIKTLAPTAKQYMDHIKLPTALMFCDFEMDFSFMENLIKTNGTWKSDVDIVLIDKNILLQKLKNLEKTNMVCVNPKILSTLDAKSLMLLDLFANAYAEFILTKKSFPKLEKK